MGSCGAALYVKKLVTTKFADECAEDAKKRDHGFPDSHWSSHKTIDGDAEHFYAWISRPFGAGTSWCISCERFTF